MFLLILEFLGTTELVVILIVALILFGPRKLPQLSRSLGKSLSDFKRASEDFKQTWEREVALESADKESRIERAMLPEDDSAVSSTAVSRGRDVNYVAADGGAEREVAVDGVAADALSTPSPPSSSVSSPTTEPAAAAAPTTAPEPTRKRDWL